MLFVVGGVCVFRAQLIGVTADDMVICMLYGFLVCWIVCFSFVVFVGVLFCCWFVCLFVCSFVRLLFGCFFEQI